MTCIAAIKNKLGRIVMAGDRKSTYDWSMAVEMPMPKIREDDSGILIGAAGDGNLCTVLVTLTSIPVIDTSNLDIYMNFKFKGALKKALLTAGYSGDRGELMLPQESQCHGLVAIQGRLYEVIICHPDDTSAHGNVLTGLIMIEEVSLPYAIGSGGPSAYPILLAERKRVGYSTKEHLKLAMDIAAEISPGVSKNVDYIQES